MVIANDQDLDMHLNGKNLLYKLTCRHLPYFFSKRHQETSVNIHLGQLVKTLPERIYQLHLVFGVNQLARMVGKSNDGTSYFVFICFSFQMPQKKLVTSMDTIEESYASGELAMNMIEILINCHF